MANFSANKSVWTPTAVADAAAMTAAGFMALQGGTSTQRIKLKEVWITGLTGASAPAPMVVARDSTVFSGASGNAVTIAAQDPATANLANMPLAQDVGSSVLPQRSATLPLLECGLNCFGGIVRWLAPQDGPLWVQGNTASFGELSLSCRTGGSPGLMSSHFIFEPV